MKPTDRPDYVTCIRHTREDKKKFSWCRRNVVEGFGELTFRSIDHALYSSESSRLVPCEDCIAAVLVIVRPLTGETKETEQFRVLREIIAERMERQDRLAKSYLKWKKEYISTVESRGEASDEVAEHAQWAANIHFQKWVTLQEMLMEMKFITDGTSVYFDKVKVREQGEENEY